MTANIIRNTGAGSLVTTLVMTSDQSKLLISQITLCDMKQKLIFKVLVHGIGVKLVSN